MNVTGDIRWGIYGKIDYSNEYNLQGRATDLVQVPLALGRVMPQIFSSKDDFPVL